MKTAEEVLTFINKTIGENAREKKLEAILSYGESIKEEYRKQDATYKIIGRRELLEDFCRRMEEWGYIDSDWWSEEPDAIDRYEQHLLDMKGER